MDADAKRVRNDIVNDMYSIRATLKNCADVLEKQKGIGCEFCATKLRSIRSRYWGYITKLNGLE